MRTIQQLLFDDHAPSNAPAEPRSAAEPSVDERLRGSVGNGQLPVWDDQTVVAQCEKAESELRDKLYADDRSGRFRRMVEAEVGQMVDQLWEETKQLHCLFGAHSPLASDALRYLIVPHIAETKIKSHRTKMREDKPWLADAEDRIVDALILHDLMAGSGDFPWVDERRAPTPEDALEGRAVLRERITGPRAKTEQRKTYGNDLEAAVHEVFRSVLRELTGQEPVVASNSAFEHVAQFNRGTYSTHAQFCGQNTDGVLRLPNGILVVAEAKFAGDATNAHKRIVREATSKWNKDGVVRLAVVEGAFKPEALLDAQEKGNHVLFREHLPDLRQWLVNLGR